MSSLWSSLSSRGFGCKCEAPVGVVAICSQDSHNHSHNNCCVEPPTMLTNLQHEMEDPAMEASQRKVFAQDGAVLIERFLDAEQLARCRTVYDWCVANPGPFA